MNPLCDGSTCEEHLENVKHFSGYLKGQPLQLTAINIQNLGLLYKWTLMRELKWKITLIPELTG